MDELTGVEFGITKFLSLFKNNVINNNIELLDDKDIIYLYYGFYYRNITKEYDKMEKYYLNKVLVFQFLRISLQQHWQGIFHLIFSRL